MNRTICNRLSPSRDDLCLQTLFLLFKCANHRNQRPFATANEALVGILITIGDVNVIFAIPNPQTGLFRKLDSFFVFSFCATINACDKASGEPALGYSPTFPCSSIGRNPGTESSWPRISETRSERPVCFSRGGKSYSAMPLLGEKGLLPQPRRSKAVNHDPSPIRRQTAKL